MLHLSNVPIEEGMRIRLPESWHEKLEVYESSNKIPYEYVLSAISKKGREKYYILKSAEKGKNFKVMLTEYTMKYLFAEAVPDFNIGFSFKNYLPLENTKILITNLQNPNEVFPAILRIGTSFETMKDEIVTVLACQITYMEGVFFDINFYAEEYTWKFIFHDDESHMNDCEKMFKDTIVHMEYVSKSIDKLARWLESEKAFEHAEKLKERAKVHDKSKLSDEEEFYALTRIINDKSSLMDANKQLTPLKKEAIALHWKNNTHHPEHFQSPIDMSKLDIMEMCCDWHARSMQYNTNFLEYIQTQQNNRFHFPNWMFAEIWQYCKVLDSEF